MESVKPTGFDESIGLALTLFSGLIVGGECLGGDPILNSRDGSSVLHMLVADLSPRI